MTSPGWYPDPWAPWALRWWDGEAWSAHQAATTPPADVEDERRKAGWLRWALLGQVVVQVLSIAGVLHFVVRVIDEVNRAVDADSFDEEAFEDLVQTSLGFQLVSWLAWVPLLAWMIWMHRSATNAAALGLPARRSPGLATAGFLIPVVNFWWPYAAVRDLFPPGHPGRRLAGPWWAAYLAASFGTLLVLPAAFGPPPVVVTAVVVVAVLSVVAMLLGLRVVAAVLDAHVALATGSRGDGDGNSTGAP